jgi:ribonuclease T1
MQNPVSLSCFVQRRLARLLDVFAGLCLGVALMLTSMPSSALSVTSESTAYLEIKFAALPIEAQKTITLIRSGGPFPYPKDGVVFGNREKNLPRQKRGYYSEYTVKTPGERSRGARRIVVGGEPRSSLELYYSDDHYQSFKRIRE